MQIGEYAMQKLQNAPGSALGRYALLFFGLLWSTISCCVFVPILGTSLVPALISGEIGPKLLNFDLIFPLCFGGVFLGVGALVTVFGLRPIIAATRVTKPDIQISNTTLKSGEAFALSYQQGFKSAVDVTRLTVQLILRESATYRRGTDTVTVTHDHLIQNFELTDRHFESSESINQSFRWAIPRGAMHTFEASRNKLRWIIKVNVEMKGWPNYDDEFAVRVLPEVA
jgi:hypothetical protein